MPERRDGCGRSGRGPVCWNSQRLCSRRAAHIYTRKPRSSRRPGRRLFLEPREGELGAEAWGAERRGPGLARRPSAPGAVPPRASRFEWTPKLGMQAGPAAPGPGSTPAFAGGSRRLGSGGFSVCARSPPTHLTSLRSAARPPSALHGLNWAFGLELFGNHIETLGSGWRRSAGKAGGGREVRPAGPQRCPEPGGLGARHTLRGGGNSAGAWAQGKAA